MRLAPLCEIPRINANELRPERFIIAERPGHDAEQTPVAERDERT
jgi:hypothetical protein